jgi:hypothetical protein
MALNNSISKATGSNVLMSISVVGRTAKASVSLFGGLPRLFLMLPSGVVSYTGILTPGIVGCVLIGWG